MENLIEFEKIDRSILQILLMDRTTGKNIIWATDSYSHLGPAYERDKQIFIDQIRDTGIIEPRIQKALEVQKERTKKNAEVFTPAWICNHMNNQVEIDWLSQESVFAAEISNSWETSKEKIRFRTKAGWKKYIRRRVLEITCGEAPFLVSRYDSSTGESIPVNERIGLLDRKLRIAAENTRTAEEWFSWVLSGLKRTYGYEFQGDSLLLGRINVFLAVVEAMNVLWNKHPDLGQQKEIATIISWNLFQMDGLTDCIPIGVPEDRYIQPTLFDFFNKSQDGNKTAPPIKIDWWDKSKRFQFRDMKEGEIMGKKFDVVIGNPPYQDESNGEDRNYAPPIYNEFMSESYKIADKVLLITPARFLFNAGSTPKKWNEERLSDPHFKVAYFEPDSRKIFPGLSTPIKGGITITYRDSTKDFGPIKAYSQFPELNTILKKVDNSKDFHSLSSIVYSRTSFRLTHLLHKDYPQAKDKLSKGHLYDMSSNIFQRIPEVFSSNVKERCEGDFIKIIGRESNKRVEKYIRREYVNHPTNLDKFKVYLSQAFGSGTFGETLSQPIIGRPGVGATETFLSIGCFESENEAKNLEKYLKTKFSRSLLGILKVTQNGNKPVWQLIPIQNFSISSDINWTKSISEIDQQLYKKYNLSPEEIDFIETHVKEME